MALEVPKSWAGRTIDKGQHSPSTGRRSSDAVTPSPNLARKLVAGQREVTAGPKTNRSSGLVEKSAYASAGGEKILRDDEDNVNPCARTMVYDISALAAPLDDLSFVTDGDLFAKRYRAKSEKAKAEQYPIFVIPKDTLTVTTPQRIYRTEICSVPDGVLKENNSPHVKAALELLSRPQWVVLHAPHGSLCSSVNPRLFDVPKWDDEESADAEVGHSGLPVDHMRNISDDEHGVTRDRWWQEVSAVRPVFAHYPDVPRHPVAFTIEAPPPFDVATNAVDKVSVTCTQLSFNFGEPLEPMFGSIYLVDAQRKKALSEVWRFNLSPDSVTSLLPFLEKQSLLAKSRSSLFSLPNRCKPHAFFVFLLHKVLAGTEINVAAEPYLKESLKPKDREKMSIDVQMRCKFLGEFTQVFGYSFVPLFDTEDDTVTPQVKPFPLLKWKSEYTEKTILEQIEQTHYQKGRRVFGEKSSDIQSQISNRVGGGVFGSLFSKNVIPATLEFRVGPANHASSQGIISSTLIPVKYASHGSGSEDLGSSDEIVREIQPFFDPTDLSSPHLEYVNTLYFYPDALHFHRHPSTSSRNIALKIKVLDSGKDARSPGLPVIYSPFQTGKFVSEQWISVTYHSSRPVYCRDEVKIQLPTALKKDHHIVVQFFHVKCSLATKKAKQDDLIQELGFAVIPIVDRTGHLLEDQEESCSVFLNYFPNYLDPVSAGAGSSSSEGGESSSSGSGAGGVTYVDQGKKLFNYRTLVVSSVHSQDESVKGFFRSISLGTEGGGAHLKKSMASLRNANPHLLERFLPVIFRHLLRVICEEKEEYAIIAVTTLASISDAVCRLHGTSHPAHCSSIHSFVHYVVNLDDVTTPPPAASLTGGEEEPPYVRGLHFKIVRTWVSLINRCQAGGSASRPDSQSVTPDLTSLASGGRVLDDLSSASIPEFGGNSKLKEELDLVSQHSWLFLSLIAKSHTLYAAGASADGLTGPREERLSREYLQALDLLLLHLAYLSTSRLNASVARFLRDALRVMPQGAVMGLMIRYVLSLDRDYSDESRVASKFTALEIFMDYEHIVPLNTPSICDAWADNVTPNLATLTRDFWIDHPVVGLLLNEVRSCFQSNSAKVRMIASRSVFNILWRLDHDPRYSSPTSLRYIADMFFPYILTLMEFWESKNSDMSHEERVLWMTPLLFLLRHASKAQLLRLWWKNDTQVGCVSFLDLLFDLVKEFELPCLAVDAACVTLAIIQDFMSDMEISMQKEDSVLLRGCLKVLDAILGQKMTSSSARSSLLSLRWFLWRFRNTLFSYKDTSYCGTLAYHVLRYSNSPHGVIRMDAGALFLLMLRLNYACRGNIARMKLQATIAISRLAEADTACYDHIREVLRAIGVTIVEVGCIKEIAAASSSSEHSEDLVSLYNHLHETLKKVIHDSERIAEYRFDPEMTEDLFFDVSIAYRDSPDLRVTWLENLAKHHTDRKNYDEAAQCRMYMAALVVLRLMETESFAERGLPTSPADFKSVSPSILVQPGLPKISASQAAEEGIYQSDLFTEQGLIRLLKEAIRLFACGGSFELGVILNEVCFVQHYAHLRHYQALSNTFRQMETFAKQLCIAEEARFFGYFYRVFFIGKGWGELDGREYIYKEQNNVSFVNVIKERFEKQFAEKYDMSRIKLLPNSVQVHSAELREKEYESGTLDREGMYWQLVSVKEYFTPAEAKLRLSQWERRYNISRFIYETPFTKGGKSDQTESVEHQWKRKQIVTTERPFPTPKKRVLVVSREILEVTPIENAIELLEEKITFLRSLMSERDPASKLQFFHRELQGAVLPMVNAGPLAIAKTFLGEYEKYNASHICKLRDTLREFNKCIYFALKIYQRVSAEGKSEEAEGERPSNDLDFATVVSQEFETKFKVTVEKLIKDSAGAVKADGETESSRSDAVAPSTERDLDTDRSEATTDDTLSERKRKEKGKEREEKEKKGKGKEREEKEKEEEKGEEEKVVSVKVKREKRSKREREKKSE